MPEFHSEEEEADWWDQNRNVADEMFRNAWPELFAKKKAAVPITIRLDPSQVATARKLASQSNIGYQTLLKNLIGIGLHGLEHHTQNAPMRKAAKKVAPRKMKAASQRRMKAAIQYVRKHAKTI